MSDEPTYTCGICGQTFVTFATEVEPGKYHLHAPDHRCLRDEFAMAALTGILAYSYNCPGKGNFHTNSDMPANADYAYRVADAMLEARKPKAAT